MWTHEPPVKDVIRQGREMLYHERSWEIASAFRILARSKKPHAWEFGERWLVDYAHWAEYERQQAA
jgi:hypothetical protein